MKAVAAVLLAVFLANTPCWSQGVVTFNNSGGGGAYRLWTNNPSGGTNFMSGQSAYRIGLFASTNLNTREDLLEMVGFTTNAAVAAGVFNGGTFQFQNTPVGTPIKFQVRAWSSNAGFTWGEVLNAAKTSPLNLALGISPVGQVTLGAAVNGPPAPNVFGTSPGQVPSGFEIRLGGFIYGYAKLFPRAASPNANFEVYSPGFASYRLYDSTNLSNWTPGPYYTNPPTYWNLSVTNPGTGYRFFQLRAEPYEFGAPH